MSNRLDSYLQASEGDLPTMPAIANQVVQAVDNPDSSIDDIRALIDQDAAIAARILKISNSALYGFPSEIQSLSHAISLLGTMTVRNLVLAASMKETYKRFGLLEVLVAIGHLQDTRIQVEVPPPYRDEPDTERQHQKPGDEE